MLLASFNASAQVTFTEIVTTQNVTYKTNSLPYYSKVFVSGPARDSLLAKELFTALLEEVQVNGLDSVMISVRLPGGGNCDQPRAGFNFIHIELETVDGVFLDQSGNSEDVVLYTVEKPYEHSLQFPSLSYIAYLIVDKLREKIQ
ncbi:MAG: hypothetical protein H6765_04680 [Candidatus Peribacteria bacterium]|nr:MAG: hypothetical protein H6765_04680 [Candidatus Peribacteria bacterium]